MIFTLTLELNNRQINVYKALKFNRQQSKLKKIDRQSSKLHPHLYSLSCTFRYQSYSDTSHEMSSAVVTAWRCGKRKPPSMRRSLWRLTFYLTLYLEHIPCPAKENKASFFKCFLDINSCFPWGLEYSPDNRNRI